jgi:PAS domain S-box-containing protein
MSALQTCRLLIVDDSPRIHEDFLKVLGADPAAPQDTDELEAELFGLTRKEAGGGLGFEIDFALQGEEALRLVEQAEALANPYAVAFVDGRMPPGWDGLETIERLSQISPELQFVLCTAYSDHTWQEILDRVGRNDNFVILKKPFDNLEVLQLAQTLARKWILSQMVNQQLNTLDTRVGERSAELRSANEDLAREMSERLQAEAHSQQMAERFVKAFDATPMPMSILSTAELRYQEVNEGFLRLFGLRRDRVLGHTPAELGLGPDELIRRTVLAPLETHATVRNLQLRFRHHSGGERITEVSAELFDFGDEPCVLMVTQDITERLALEARLRQAHKLEAVGQLAAGIAHDFNNLVTIVMGHAELQLATAELTPDLHDSFQQINAAAHRAAGLTRQLLAFSRREPGTTEPLALKTLIDSVARLLGRLLGEHIELQVTCPTDLPLVEANPGEIEQVLINLAVNGRDAMPRGGHLRLIASTYTLEASTAPDRPEVPEGRYVCLSIIDQGCGMDEVTRKRIFEPFFTTKAPGKGTGMGLASVFGIIKQHHGWIEVDTVVGHGSTFRVYLPVSLRAINHARVVKTGAPQPLLAATVLLVEDEAELRTLAHRILTRNGFTVLEAEDGPGALALSRQRAGQIDLLLTDVVMPGGLSGVELAEQLRAEQPALRVVYTSGHNEDLLGSTVSFVEGVNFIQKPFSLGALLNTLNRALAANA